VHYGAPCHKFKTLRPWAAPTDVMRMLAFQQLKSGQYPADIISLP